MKLSSKKQTEYDLLLKTLVGREIKIIDSKIVNQIGLWGVVIFETFSFLILDLDGREMRIFKKNIIFQIDYEGKSLNIDGRLIFNTIINRIKKIR